MNQRPSLSQRGIVHLLAIVIGLGLLAVLAFSLNALFASRSQQSPQVARPPEVKRQSNGDIAKPSPGPPVATNQTDPTESWKIYTDTTYSYTVKYPHTWYEFARDATYNTPPTHIFQRANPAKVGETLKDRTYVAVRIWEDSEIFRSMHGGQDLQTYFKQLHAQPIKVGPSSTKVKIENLVLAGQPAVKFIGQTPAGAPTEPAFNISIFVFKEPFLYEITAHGPGREAVDEIEEVFNLMSQTFRFVQ